MCACISYKLDEVGFNMHYKWVFGSHYQIKGLPRKGFVYIHTYVKVESRMYRFMKSYNIRAKSNPISVPRFLSAVKLT